MRLHPFSLTADLVSPASGDSARTGGRKSPDVPKFFTIGQLAELLEVSTRQTRPRADARLLWAPLSKEHEDGREDGDAEAKAYQGTSRCEGRE
jgi:hypothetical protein